MKILLTMNLPYTRAYGGANRSNRALAEALASRHHSVYVVVPALAAVSSTTHRQFRDELTAEGIRVNFNGESDVFSLNGVEVHAVVEPSRLCGYLAGQIRKLQPHWTLVSSEDRSQALLESALKARSERVIYLAHTPQMFPFGPAGLFPGKRRTELVGQASAVITISRFVADYIRQWTGFESFVHHPPHYGSGPFPNFGNVDNEYILLMNACAVKGISMFLALAHAMPDIKFAALPGWGTTATERMALAGLRNVTLLSNCKNLDDVFCRTRAVLMPSLWVEGFGMATVDAMLRGIPVLTANYGGLIEAKLGTDYLLPVNPIERFEDRLDDNLLPVPIVPPQDIKPWQNALSHLVSDRDLYERQSAAARDAALRFVGGLSVEPLEDLLRLAAEVNSDRQRSLSRLNHQSTHLKADTGANGASLADLTPEQQALLMLRLRKSAIGRAKKDLSVPPIKRISRDQELPLSFAQQRLWFLDQLEPGNPTYNMPAAFRLKGPLHVAALERSLNEIVRRHEALRTTFTIVGGEPVQVIAPNLTVTLRLIDLQQVQETEREARARQLAADEARFSFDLAQGPLIRSTLLRLGPQDHILLVNMHHIVFDGWSRGVLFRELSALYVAFAEGKPSALRELVVQYKDFAVWQRQWLQGEVLETQLSYWRKQLATAPQVLDLPTDYSRTPIQTYRGATESQVLSTAVSEGLRALSVKENVTLFMTLLAVFQTLLHLCTGQDEILVGTPIAGRHRLELEGLIGFFLNSLVLCTDLSGNPTFRELLARVRQVTVGAYSHQDLPFEKLLEELRPERDLSRTPLFQVYFNMMSSADRLQFPGVTVETISGLEPASKFDLTLYLREEARKIHLNLVYNVDLFKPVRMAEMLRQFVHLVSQILENPDERIERLSLVTPNSEKCLPSPTQPLDSSWKGAVHTQFSLRAQTSPQREAVIDSWGAWSYSDLDSRSNQLANYLLAHGIRPEDVVAIYGHRSAPLVLAVLGVLKAGAAFLILDPSYPTTRLIDCLQEARPRGWLQIEAAGPLPDAVDKFIASSLIHCRLKLSHRSSVGSSGSLSGRSLADPQVAVGPDSLAYLAFTSGSTGRPKGIRGRHGSLSHFLPWQQETFELSGSDRFSMLSGLSHDPLQRDIFTALWVGGTICIPDAEIIGTPRLADWMVQQKISFAHLTPAMSEVLTEPAASDCCIPSLRYTFFVGDKLTRADVVRLKRLAPQVTCITSYGSTETQRAVGYYVVPQSLQSEQSREKAVYPLGRGIKDVQLLVSNREQRLAGIGELGEIYVRSSHLALGYLSNNALTEERFLTNPFTGIDDDRLYRTGDLGRYLPDGNVEFVGRADRQGKIRGFRIEPEEVEAVVGQHSAIQQTLVVIREDVPDQKRLVAYLIARGEQVPAASELRSFVKSRLPEYMVPAAFVYVDALPLTSNSKVDRSVLPAPDCERQEQEETLVAPRDGLELQLRQIWEKVLRVRRIGIRDNFFDLGGHSLLAVRLFAHIEKVTGKNLPVAALFHAPTIEQLARLMSQQGWSAQWKSLVAIQPGGSRPPFFCVHAHDGGVLFWRDLAKHLGPDQPFYALQPQGLDGRPPPDSRIEEMAAHYIEEIRTLQPEGPYFIGGHCIGGLMAFEMAQQLHRQGERVELLALFDSYAPGRNKWARNSFLYRYRYKAIRLFEMTVGLHVSNLLIIEPKGRLSYLKEKFNKALYKLYMGLGSAWIPAAQRRQNILKAGSQAARNYDPKIYPGKVTLFRATQLGGGIDHDPQMGWGGFAGGGLEIHLIPGYHAHIVLEPRVRVLAEKLAACLERASATPLPREKEFARASSGF